MSTTTETSPALAANTRAGKGRTVELLVYGLLALLFLVQLCGYLRIEDYGHDASVYRGSADSLRTTGRYEFNFKPAVTYPPGLPLLLAVSSSVLGESQQVVMWLMSGFGFLGLMLAHRVVKLRAGPMTAAAASLLLMSSPHYFAIATGLLGSDLPYLFFSMLFVMSAEQLGLATPGRCERFIATAIAAASLIATFMIRSVGVSLVMALVLWVAVLWKSRAAKATLVSLGLICILAIAIQTSWTRFTAAHVVRDWPAEPNTTYIEQLLSKNPAVPEAGRASLGDLLSRPGKYAAIHAAHIAELFTHVAWVAPHWSSPAVAVVFGLLITGLLSYFFHSGVRLTELYFVFYVAFYLVWPFDVGPRFMIPIAPLAFMYMMAGVETLLAYVGSRPVAAAKWSSVIAIAMGIIAGAQLVMGQQASGMQARLGVATWLGLALACAIIYGFLRRDTLANISRSIPGPSAFSVRIPRLAAVIALTGLIAFGISQQMTALLGNLHPDATAFHHAGSVEAARWLSSHGNATVMAEQVGIVYRISKLRTVSFPATADPKLIHDVIVTNRVKFLVVTNGTNRVPNEQERLQALQQVYPGLLSLAAAGSGFKILSLAPDVQR